MGQSGGPARHCGRSPALGSSRSPHMKFPEPLSGCGGAWTEKFNLKGCSGHPTQVKDGAKSLLGAPGDVGAAPHSGSWGASRPGGAHPYGLCNFPVVAMKGPLIRSWGEQHDHPDSQGVNQRPLSCPGLPEIRSGQAPGRGGGRRCDEAGLGAGERLVRRGLGGGTPRSALRPPRSHSPNSNQTPPPAPAQAINLREATGEARGLGVGSPGSPKSGRAGAVLG